MNIIMCIDLLNNEIMASTDLSAAKRLRCDLPNKECPNTFGTCSQC